MKRASLFLLLMAQVVHSFGQSSLPSVIPPSPMAMQFQKYADYPVSHFTGVPEIKIPLYTIKEGDLELPITLSYHASGVKPDDFDGIAGVGWVLNAGGTITRTIMAKDDITHYFPDDLLTNEELGYLTPANQIEYIRRLESTYDSRPDVFSYNFSGNVGKFILNRIYESSSSTSNRTVQFLSYTPIKFTPEINNFHLNEFDVKDEKGLHYTFNHTSHDDGFNKSWWVTSIASPSSGNKKIDIQYQAGPGEIAYKRIDYFRVDDNFNYTSVSREKCGSIGIDYFAHFTIPSTDFTYQQMIYQGPVPQIITFNSGKLVFYYDNTLKKLAKIEVKNSSDGIIQTIELIYEKKARTFLKAVKFYGANHEFINQYSFDYISENNELHTVNRASTDYWGYCNGVLGMEFSNLLPNWPITYYSMALGTRSRNIGNNTCQTYSDLMMFHTLNSITYPTGGRTLFDYEANRYSGVGITGYGGQDVGGLRVKSITDYDSDEHIARTKIYKYGINECGYGIMDIYPDKKYFGYSERHYIIDPRNDWESFRRMIFSSVPMAEIAPHGSPVTYTSVAEYITDGTKSTGKTVYEYDHDEHELTFPITNGVFDQDGAAVLYKPYEASIKASNDGKLTSVASYKLKENGLYELVKHTSYGYEEIPKGTIPCFYFDRFVEYHSDECTSSDKNQFPDKYVLTHGKNILCPFNYADYSIVFNEKRLKSTVESTGLLTIETILDYGDNEHAQPIRKTVTTSKGDQRITIFKYPHDFSSQSPYNSMVADKHMWSQVIEQQEYKNNLSGFLESTITNYADWGNNVIAPKSAASKTGSLAYETRLRYHNYDNDGNLVSVAKENDQMVSYLWDYNKTLPIAECINAGVDDIAYTSFEADGKGNWSYAGTPAAIANAPTGRKAYTLNGSNAISRTGLVAAKTYLISYWTLNSNAFAIAGNMAGYPVRGKNIGGWTLFTHKISGQTVVSINGSGVIDELRLYPEMAEMKSYTYDQLIGKTSECDVNNVIIYFEYDKGRRLSVIRDRDKNIIKRYCYSYMQNKNSCDGLYYNSLVSKTLQRNNCGVDQFGSQVTYTVTAGEFSSTISQEDADAQALNQLNQQVQAYANTHGTCIQNYYNIYKEQAFVRQGCASGTTGSSVTYVVPARKHRSIISQQDANNMAQADIDQNGQDYANSTGTCPLYANQFVSGDFYSENCPDNYSPDPFYVEVAAGLFTSTVSQHAANLLAVAHGQQVANTSPSATCYLSGTYVTYTVPVDRTEWTITFTNTTTQQTYTFEIDGNTTGTLGSVPFGEYDIHFSTPVSDMYEFKAGCSGYHWGENEFDLNDITIDQNCNSLIIDPF